MAFDNTPTRYEDPLAKKLRESSERVLARFPQMAKPGAWVPKGPWAGVADEMDAAKARGE